MQKIQKKDIGIVKLYRSYRKAFRIPENLNHYSEEDFRNAEKTFIKLCFLGKLEECLPG